MTAIQLLVLFVNFGSDVQSAESVVQKVINARKSIRTIHIKFRCERFASVAGTLQPDEIDQVECWLDEEHYRMDRVREGKRKSGSEIGRRVVVCKNCERPGHIAFYVEGVSGVELFSPSDKASQGYMNLTYNPLQIGFTSWYLMSNNTSALGDNIASKKFTDPTVANITYNGESALRLQSQYVRSGASHVVMVLPNKGNSVAKFESILAKGGEKHSTTHVSELHLDTGSGIWFPKKSLLEIAKNDTVVGREMITVQECRINQPIPSRVFTIEGISVAKSTPVFVPESGNRLDHEWSGTSIVRSKDDPYSPASTANVDVPMPEPVDKTAVGRKWKWWYVSAAGLFAMATGLLFWRALRKRTSA